MGPASSQAGAHIVVLFCITFLFFILKVFSPVSRLPCSYSTEKRNKEEEEEEKKKKKNPRGIAQRIRDLDTSSRSSGSGSGSGSGSAVSFHFTFLPPPPPKKTKQEFRATNGWNSGTKSRMSVPCAGDYLLIIISPYSVHLQVDNRGYVLSRCTLPFFIDFIILIISPPLPPRSLFFFFPLPVFPPPPLEAPPRWLPRSFITGD